MEKKMEKKMEKEKRMSFRKDERGISAVIGVLLMVAVTVIMASVILVWSGSISAPETPKSCGVSVTRVNDTLIRVTVTNIQPSSATISSITCNDAKVKGLTAVGKTAEIKVPSGNYVLLVCNWADGTKDVIYDAKP